MRPSRLNLSSMAIASLAFLLNWLVFVDSTPLVALTEPFDVEGSSQRSTLAPIFPPDKAVLAFETQSYAVELLERSGAYYLSVRHRSDGTTLVNAAAVEAVYQGDRLHSYRYHSVDTAQPELEVRLDKQIPELWVQKADTQQVETAR